MSVHVPVAAAYYSDPGPGERWWRAPRTWWRFGRRLVVRHPWLVTAALAGLVVLTGVTGPDLPAQEFRLWLYRHYGEMLFDGQWYGGHLLPGYSMLFPPLAALVGSQLLGALCCVGSTVLATRLLRRGRTDGHTLALLWFAVITVADLVIGRLPFALGLTFALAAALAVQHRRWLFAAPAALACSLASPLAAAFLLLAGVAWASSIGWRRVAPLAAAGVGLGVAALFGDGGRFPFAWSSLAAILAFVAVGLWLCPPGYRAVRVWLCLYGAAAVLLFCVPNPVGGNLTRLGTICAGPLAALVLTHVGRRRALVLIAGPLLFWQLQPVAGALAQTTGDPSAQPGYYNGLLGFLAEHDTPQGRVEIPLTRDHWESSYVAAQVPLARGWERQLDTAYNAVLYDPQLTPDTYHSWLLSMGVRYVALPDVPLESSALAEVRILQARPPWLRPVWHDAHWQVWQVTDATPMAIGPAQLTWLGVTGFVVDFAEPGTDRVLVHYTRFWQTSVPQACTSPSRDGWTLVTSTVPGPVTVQASFSLHRLVSFSGNGDCPVAANQQSGQQQTLTGRG